MQKQILINRKKTIPLFWWSEIKFTFKEKENYGDLLSKYLVEKISGRKVHWVHPKKLPWYKGDKKNLLGAGSIIHHATKDSIVWGSGIIDQDQEIQKASFLAVRGPQTRKYLMELGYECPAVFGDPALLLPLFYKPEVKKKYKIGIVPHYHDYSVAAEMYKNDKEINVIDLMTLDVEDVTKQILACEKTVSSSLHGLIVSHAYGIPAIWVEFSDKIFGNGIKYRDYLESVGLAVYKPVLISEKIDLQNLAALFEEYPSFPKEKTVENLQEGLLSVCPFPVLVKEKKSRL